MKSAVLKLKNIGKQFPGVEALKGVDLDLYPGEVHALVGVNGAGKSTLVKILAGVYQPDSGQILFNEKPVFLKGPQQALDMGISVVHQNFNLIHKMDVAQNIFLARLPLLGKVVKRVDWGRIYAESAQVLKRLHLDISPRTKVGDLTVADQQMVEIAKALARECQILILDEPTSALSKQETDQLFEKVLRLRGEGVAILYISHRLEEIKKIGDQLSVFRDGMKIGSDRVENVRVDRIIEMMLGREIQNVFPWSRRELGKELLRVEGLTVPGLIHDVNLVLHEGEILGIGGLVGARRTELAHAIFGALPEQSGRVMYQGKTVKFKSPRDAIRVGIGLLPEDKARHGIFSPLTVANNITSAGLDLIKGNCGLSISKERSVAQEYVRKLHIRTPSINNTMDSLSGGNQQKVMLAKAMFTNSSVLIFDEPTKGIDVGAKEEIYHLIIELACEKKGIIMISSEVPELLGMSDRILVMKNGRITAEMAREEANQENIMEAAL
jgi:ribose transport system ATP-binding protein